MKKNKLPESTTGYTCPNCERICGRDSYVSMSKVTFKGDHNPQYSWVETHKCLKCGISYNLHNGT